jgi:hypothetical protein
MKARRRVWDPDAFGDPGLAGCSADDAAGSVAVQADAVTPEED